MIWNETLKELFEYLQLDENNYSVLDMYQLEDIIKKTTPDAEEQYDKGWIDGYEQSEAENKDAIEDAEYDSRSATIEEVFNNLQATLYLRQQQILSERGVSEDPNQGKAEYEAITKLLDWLKKQKLELD